MSGIGQYVPLDSPLHRLDAAAKLGIVVALTVGLFLPDPASGTRSLVALFAITLSVVAAVGASRVPARAVTRGLRAVGLIVVLTLVFNAMRWQPVVALARLGPLGVDGAGLQRGIFFAVRILVLVVGTSLLTLTTSPVQLSGGIERVLAPLKWLHVPVGDLALTLTIALRFIPTTAEEAEGIVMAQQARGAVFDRGGPIARARAYVPVLVPLFFQLFRRADALATAMEARCFRGTEGRTRMKEERMGRADWIAMLGVGAALIAMGWIL
jgi:energy-coupling factor transport system permease protein